MSHTFGPETLMILPCSARKLQGGQKLEIHSDPHGQSVVSSAAYSAMLKARACAFKITSEKNEKNSTIKAGPDFGGDDANGVYLPALSRYVGTLYSIEGFKEVVQKTISSKDCPRIMILSALYGPLDPRSCIQDYNLKMSDPPARIWSTAFPLYLKDYVRNNGIENIILYLGSSTAYFRVTQKAVADCCNDRLIKQAVQYHVENGNSQRTPKQHGLRLLDDLNGARSQAQRRSCGIKEYNLCRPEHAA